MEAAYSSPGGEPLRVSPPLVPPTGWNHERAGQAHLQAPHCPALQRGMDSAQQGGPLWTSQLPCPPQECLALPPRWLPTGPPLAPGNSCCGCTLGTAGCCVWPQGVAAITRGTFQGCPAEAGVCPRRQLGVGSGSGPAGRAHARLWAAFLSATALPPCRPAVAGLLQTSPP